MAFGVSYASGTSDQPLLGMTIGQKFDEVVHCYGDREALVSMHQDVRLTYGELASQVDTVARAFMAVGIEKGDRVGIWAPNTLEWLLTQYATARIGALLVTINPAYRVHELEYVLGQSGCRALVLQNQFKTSDYEAMICELCPELARCEPGHLRCSRLPNLEMVISTTSSARSGIFDWDRLLSLNEGISDDQLRARQRDQDMDDPINIQYTSGTTGFPKGATLSHHNILNNGYFTARIMNFSEVDRLAVPVPLYHCFGMVMANLGCMTHGAALIYPAEGFEPLAVLEAVQREKATALFGVPTMFIAELAHEDFGSYDLRTLRTGIMAGAPCPVDTMKQVIDKMHMKEIEIAYGMTETSPVSFQTRADAPLEKRVSTVGRVHPHVEVKVIDADTGHLASVNEVGELCTRGYSVMLGYWQNSDATRLAIDNNGWMHTGDLAVMDEDGYVNIAGRIKDMIVRGGENIYPREIEEFLIAHEAIADVQVTGVPDSKFGEEIVAWIMLKPDNKEPISETVVRAFCRGQIAHYKIPRYIKFIDEFPMTVTGKVQKYKMREISISELGLEEVQTA